MSQESAVRAGRMAAERNMVDACEVWRIGPGVEDPVTGIPAPSRTLVHSGRCKVGGDRPYENKPEAGAAIIVTQRFTIHLPWSAGPFFPGDLAVITKVVLQPNMVGNEYRIAGPDERTAQTAQRMFVDIAENKNATT